MTSTTPFSELEAVNELLAAIGQAPVNSFSGGVNDANIARNEVTRVTRFVQLRGYKFNTDTDYVFQPNSEGVIAVPPGMLKFKVYDRRLSITTRKHPATGQMAFYDTVGHTFVFPDYFLGDIVWGTAFEELPETARAYVAAAAARKFQARVVGDQLIDRALADTEQRAWVLLERDERASRDTNMFRKSPSLQRAYNRSRWLPTR